MASAIVKDMEIRNQEEGDWVEATVLLTLGEIIEMDIEALNDFVEENIFDDGSANLLNIGYAVTGCNPDDNVVNVKVTADVDYWEQA